MTTQFSNLIFLSMLGLQIKGMKGIKLKLPLLLE